MTGLSVGQRVIVRFPGNKRAWGVIKEVDTIARRYLVLIEMAPEPKWFPMSRVQADGKKPTANLADFATPAPWPTRPVVNDKGVPILRPIPKPELPEECPAWLKFVKKFPCCNCGATLNVQAHHEGKKDAAFQKVRDTLALSLCLECHLVLTAKNRLPIKIKASGIYGEADLLSREISLAVLRDEQDRLLGLALRQLDQQERIELLSKGLAKVKGLASLLERVGKGA